MTTTTLERPVTAYQEAARNLRIPPATLRAWLEGVDQPGRRYEPVLRPKATGDLTMTWGEMVEARYLRAYRERRVSLQRIRPFVTALREEFGVPHPLAHFRPYVDASRRLLVDLQNQLDLPAALWLVYEGRAGQYVLNQMIESDFLDQVEFDEGATGEALRIFPMGKDSPVVIDPRVGSGAATIHGVRTAELAERFEVFGETPAELAEEFELDPSEVKQGIVFEFAA